MTFLAPLIHLLGSLLLTILYPIPDIDFPTRPNQTQKGIIRSNENSIMKNLVFRTGDDFYLQNKRIGKIPNQYLAFLNNEKLVYSLNDHLILEDRNEGIVWKKQIDVHHSLITSNDEIGIISTDHSQKDTYGNIHNILIYNLKGEEVFHWSPLSNQKNFESFSGNTIQKTLNIFGRNLGFNDSLFKINSIAFIKENKLYPDIPYLKPGNLIISFHANSFVAILDRESKKLVWKLPLSEKRYQGVHALNFTSEGLLVCSQGHFKNENFNFFENILFYLAYFPRVRIFGFKNFKIFIPSLNTYYKLNHSRIFKYNFREKQITWEYQAPFRFFSPYMGHVQALDNGNLLVTHLTYGGAAFEITPDKKIVWEWINPDFNDLGLPKDNIYAVNAYPVETISAWINDL